MPKIKPVLHTISVLTIAAGFTVVGVGAFFLKRLDDHAFGDPSVFYAAVRHYGLITSAGIPVCLVGCLGLALTLSYRQGFRAAAGSIIIGVITAIFGLFLFSIHNASGAVYFTLLGVTFGASLVFLLAASVRYAWFRTHLRSSR